MQSKYVPDDFELNLTDNNGNSLLEIKLSDGVCIKINGKIDRVDIFERFMTEKINIFGLTVLQLQEIVKSIGLPVFTASQIAEWLYQRRVTTFSEMTNLSKKARELLDKDYCILLAEPSKVQVSVDGTKKYLYPTEIGKYVEAAYIPEKERATLCVSTQIGCKMGRNNFV